MAKRSNHYDVAFERLLRLVRRPYVSVDETRRALYRNSSLKSMDFVVYSQTAQNLLIDVKGRRFPQGHRSWKSWTMKEDVDCLLEWENVFGSGFRSLFVFAYEVLDSKEMNYHDVTWDFKNRRYAFYGVWTRDYAQVMKTCSASWQTVYLPASDFHQLRHPILEFL